MFKPILCDYSDECTLVKGRITVSGVEVTRQQDKQVERINKQYLKFVYRLPTLLPK